MEDIHSPQGKHTGSITELCFTGKQLITAGMDGHVKGYELGATQFSTDVEETGPLALDSLLAWGVESSSSVGPSPTPAAEASDRLAWSVAVEESGVAHLRFDPRRERALVSTGDHEVRLLDGRLEAVQLRLRSAAGAVTAVALDRWCRLLAGSVDHSVMVCDGASDAVVAWLDEATAVSTLAVGGGWVVVPGAAYSLRVLNSAWEECFLLEGHRGQVTAVAMDATTVVSSSNDVMKNGGSEG